MINPTVVAQFMEASGQELGSMNTAVLYDALTREEYAEKRDAFDALVHCTATPSQRTEHLDGIVDTIWCLIGEAYAMGYDISGAFSEVARSNMTKIDEDGTVHKSSIGKVTKPTGYSKPDLTPYI